MTGWYSYGTDNLIFKMPGQRRYTLYIERERKEAIPPQKDGWHILDALLANKIKLNNNNDIVLMLIEHFQFYVTVISIFYVLYFHLLSQPSEAALIINLFFFHSETKA